MTEDAEGGADHKYDLQNENVGVRKFYGRRKGKSLRQEQTRRLETLLPQYAVGREGSDNADSELWLEIGFGGGEHLFHLCGLHADKRIIGCEPFQNGVVKCLSFLEQEPRDNLSIHPGDARDLIDALPDACLSRVYLLYPDPWPKLRHQKRRFIGQENLTLLSRVMKAGAELRFATDISHYVKTALRNVDAHPAFSVKSMPCATPWGDWHRTRYEEKAIREGREPSYVVFERI